MILDGPALRDVLGVAVPEVQVSAVTNDSRAVSPGTAYVAIKGFTTDGAQFVPQALEQGATLIVADHPIDGAPTAVVPDTRAALARLAVAVNGDPSKDLTVYGITGTNGKTTSSYVLHGILTGAYGAAKTGLLSTAEIIVGRDRQPAVRTTGEAPLVQGTLARMRDEGVRYVVLETSSHGIALQRVAGTHYAAALFTNLSRDHLDFHPTMEDYYLTKRRLFEWTDGPKLANADDEYGDRLAAEIPGTLRFGTASDADYRALGVVQTGAGTDFTLRTPPWNCRCTCRCSATTTSSTSPVLRRSLSRPAWTRIGCSEQLPKCPRCRGDSSAFPMIGASRSSSTTPTPTSAWPPSSTSHAL
ncbi:Mur ligase family protein [Branchiibius cervicis]|uniref:Mur ligase family protein n=1 Tax=Branchiibius cervicis TaxID=908252 RepID=A0ABW2AZV5_9MICO